MGALVQNASYLFVVCNFGVGVCVRGYGKGLRHTLRAVLCAVRGNLASVGT